MARVTAPTVRGMKAEGRPVVSMTAYDVFSASLGEEAGADVLLVGDSLGNVVLGLETTVEVDLEHVAYHTRAVARAARRALVVADLPFGSYGASVEQAVRSAALLAKAGAQAVKLEGPYVEEVQAIVRSGVPVMGHVGMTPQSVNNFGGFKVQGRGHGAEEVVEAALALEHAGAFAVVVELVPADLAVEITSRLSIPTIGIGAGPGCDGQVQVFHDMLGLGEHTFRHAKRYVEGRAILLDAARRYCEEVRAGEFPTAEHAF